MQVPPTLKYTVRHALKRNPWVLRRCAELISRERVHPTVHRARQEARLAQLFRHARHAPAYAQAAQAPERDRLGFLRSAFPIIDKTSLLRAQSNYFPHGRIPAWYRAIVAETSGTTGTPLNVYRSLGSTLTEEAFQLQHWHWAGWRSGWRQAVLRGEIVVPVERREPPFWFEDRAGGQLVLSTRHLDRQTAGLFAAQIARFGPTQLRAYPSAAYELATFVAEANIPVHFDAVVTSSEMLYDFQRERIESVFKTQVFDSYGMAERVAFAAECELGGMHVNPEYGVVEIVDEQGEPTEDEGTIVGTALFNSAMPLIRYRMNDTARWSREPCACGRTYPVIEKISGRLADQLFDLDGRAVNCTVIGFAFDGMRNIRKAQVVQTAADRWLIRIVPDPGYVPADGQRVLDKLAHDVSPRVKAEIAVVDSIPVLPSGKYKWVLQDYRRATPAGAARPVAHANAQPTRVTC